jgi:hypothetical protein
MARHRVHCFQSITQPRHSIISSTNSASRLRLQAGPNKPNNNNNNAPPSQRRDQLRRVIQSIEFYGQNPEDQERGASKELLEAVALLAQARTQKEVIFAGRRLETLDIVEGESRAVQERVLKATALSGLLHTSWNLLDKMLDEGYLPSHMSYTAVCSALRRAGRNDQLEELLYSLAEVAAEHDAPVHVVAFNTYLASICSSVRVENLPQSGLLLDRAWRWLQPQAAQDVFRVAPDLASYNTVLHTAARVGNGTLLEALWNELAQQRPTIQPDIRSYNARLMVARNPQRLAILEELSADPDVSPDRYTIDLVMLPLIQEGRVGEVEDLLDAFVAKNADAIIKDAFSAFLITLVQKGEISSARALFDTYIAPCLGKQSLASAIRPNTRHFNVMIDGYRRLAETKSNDKETEAAQYEGRKLYRLMRDSGIEADAYTLTSMMGFCKSTKEILQLIQSNLKHIPPTPAVVRAAITACGRLGDPSSAVALFDRYTARSMNARVWNVLMGALSDGAKLGNLVLDTSSSNATQVSCLVDGLSCTEAVCVILQAMRGDEVSAPNPNSQSYCIAASAVQYGDSNSAAQIAMELFRNSTDEGIPADGRFVNAIFRCFGDDIDAAVASWKQEIRTACVSHESRTRTAPRSVYRSKNKNLIAAYNGLLYVCGRALRPDIALRLAYAMNREGIEPNDVSFNNYSAGKRRREQMDPHDTSEETRKFPLGSLPKKLLPRIIMVDQYENLLYVECTKYDQYSKRMSNDKRVRIIV